MNTLRLPVRTCVNCSLSLYRPHTLPHANHRSLRLTLVGADSTAIGVELSQL